MTPDDSDIESAAEYMANLADMELAFTDRRRREILSILGYYDDPDHHPDDPFPTDEREALAMLAHFLDQAVGCVTLLDDGATPPEYRENRIAEARAWLESAANLTEHIRDQQTNAEGHDDV